MTLSPTCRLILLSLEHTPNQTHSDLMRSTGVTRAATIRELLTLLIALKLVSQSDTEPTTYSRMVAEPTDVSA